jgi:hypothetical protein
MATTLNSSGIVFPDATTQTSAAGVSGFVLITSATPTSATTFDTFINSFSSTYGTYMLIGENIATDSAGTIMIRFASASSPDTSTKYSSASGAGVTNDTAYTLNNQNEGSLIEGPTDTGGASFKTNIYTPNGSNVKFWQTVVSRQASSTTWKTYSAAGAYTGTSSGGFRLYLNSGPKFLAQGKFYLYGLRA